MPSGHYTCSCNAGYSTECQKLKLCLSLKTITIKTKDYKYDDAWLEKQNLKVWLSLKNFDNTDNY